MFSKILNFWYMIKSNLWFTPALYCLVYFVSTIGLVAFDLYYIKGDIELPPFFFKGTIEETRSLIIPLMSAMITMATLAISITVVVLSLAASQLGPRLLITFMSDRTTKSYIGMFFGVIVSCFILALVLHDMEVKPDGFLPYLTINAVFFLCFMNLFVLLGFVNHASHLGIADNVVLSVSNDLYKAIDKLENREEGEKDSDTKGQKKWPDDFAKKSVPIFFGKNGYIQHIDYNELRHLCEEHNAKIEVKVKAGHFIIKGEEYVRIYPKQETQSKLIEKIHACFIIGEQRTPTQDLEYSIRHLVEIAIRALSPGINDSFTALHVIDHLAAGISKLFDKQLRSTYVFNEDGKMPLVKCLQTTENDIVSSAFDQILENGRNHSKVVECLTDRLKALKKIAVTDEQKKAVKQQLDKF